jgi:hypothetical protein
VSYGNPDDDFLLATYNYVPMSYAEFSRSLEDNEPPSGLPPLLEALWWDAKGDWSRAHGLRRIVNPRMRPGCTPICTVKMAMPAMPAIGMAGRGNHIVRRRQRSSGGK